MEKKTKVKSAATASTHPAVIIAAGLAIILSIISIVRTSSFYKTRAEESIVAEDISYNVYIGLTDKNQKRQIIDENAAVEIIKSICINHKVGYTIYNANGGYNDDGIIHTEKTIVLEMDRIVDETLNEILNDVKRRINTNSVMVLKHTAEIYDY